MRKSYLQYIIQRTTDDPTLAFGFLDAQGKLSYDLSARHSISLNLIDGHSDGDRTAARATLGANSVMTSAYHVFIANLGWRYAPGDRLLVTNRIAFLRERFDNQDPQNLSLEAGMYGEWVWNSTATWSWNPHGSLDEGWSLRRIRDDGFTNNYQFNPLAIRRLDDYRGNAWRGGGYASKLERRRRAPAPGGGPALGPALAEQKSRSFRRKPRWACGCSIPRESNSVGVNTFNIPELNISLSQFGSRALLPSAPTISWRRSNSDWTTRGSGWSCTSARTAICWRAPFTTARLGGQIFNPPANPLYRNSVRGYARGVEIFLQRRTANRLTGWVSLRSRLCPAARRRGACLLSGGAGPASHRERLRRLPHQAQREPERALDLRERLPDPGYLRYDGSRYFLSEARNLVRLDAYQRADVRINKSFGFRRSRLTLYGEVVNLLNRSNYRFDSFNGYNARTGQATVHLDKMFPILPSGRGLFWRSRGRGILREPRRRIYKRLLDNLRDGVYFVDLERRITFWSKGAERLTGFTSAEVTGRHCWDSLLSHVDAQGCRVVHGRLSY